MRMTRAALRAQAVDLNIHEDEGINTDFTTSTSSQGEPSVLKEVTNTNNNVLRVPVSPAKTLAADTTIDIENSKQNNTTLFSPKAAQEAFGQSIHDDASLCSVADPVDQQKEVQADFDKDQLATPAVSRLFAEPAPKSIEFEPAVTPSARSPVAAKTPKFDPSVNEPAVVAMNEEEDSFVNSIKSRTPGRMTSEAEKDGEDSFVEKITSRTPRRTSRIEDSVEAMDALEDAIEQFSGELPVLDELHIDSPIKERHDEPKTKAQSTLKQASIQAPSAPNSRGSSKSPAKSLSKTVVQKPTNAPPPSKRPIVARPSVIKPQRALSATTTARKATQPDDKASMSFSNSPSKTLPNIKKRATSGPLSTSRPGFVPAKSTKAPTKSSFVLPGDIYAAKMKAEREAKKVEDEQPKQFKARPVPTSRPSVLPRENKASQARMSVAGSVGAISQPSGVANKRISSLDVAKVRNSSNDSAKRASSIISKTSRSSSKEPKFAANVPRVASLTSKPVTAAPEPEPVTVQKVSGKQAFARPKLELKKQEEEKRQKEEAARKARAEAAERGRIASREWAEKKAKLAAAQKSAAK